MASAIDFLRTLAAQQFDTDSHLVYADWLEESGDSDLAELVRLTVFVKTEDRDRRVQRETSKSGQNFCTGCGERTRCKRKCSVAAIRERLEVVERIAHRKPPFDKFLRVKLGMGLVREVTCSSKHAVDHLPALCERHPITSISLLDWTTDNSVNVSFWTQFPVLKSFYLPVLPEAVMIAEIVPGFNVFYKSPLSGIITMMQPSRLTPAR